MNKSRELVRGIYSTPQPNDEILLTEESIEFKHRDLKARGNAKVVMRLLPRPRILITIKLLTFPFYLISLMKQKSVINFISHGLSIEINVINIIGYPKEYLILAEVIKEPIIFSASENVSKIIFHILNFPKFLGPRQAFETIDGKSYPGGKVILKYDDWQIFINAALGFEKVISLLNENGGFAITHIGMVKKSNGKPFKISEGCKILDALDFYLSFCTGYFTCTFLPVGLNKKNERVWERWGIQQADPWQPILSWFHRHYGKLLSDVFPGFFRIWKNKIWNKSIENVIYWYLKSNTRSAGDDGSIVLAQAALELLSWVFLTEDKKALSSEGFKLLHADDLIRLLLSSQDIKLEVPSYLSKLVKLAKELTWDGPKAITEVRNFIVHHGKENKRIAGREIPYGEVLNLALWYLELVFLHLFGHKGVYANRLICGRYIGDVSPVPLWKVE